MEKRVWIAAALSVLFLTAYSQIFLKTEKKAQSLPQEAGRQETAVTQSRVHVLQEHSNSKFIRSEGAIFEFSEETGEMVSVVLKEYKDMSTGDQLRIWTGYPIFRFELTGIEIGKAVSANNSITWPVSGIEGLRGDLSVYQKGKYGLQVTANIEASTAKAVPIKIISTWRRSDLVTGRYSMLEAVFHADKVSSWQRQYLKYVLSSSKNRHVPRRTFAATLSERFFCESVKKTSGTFDEATTGTLPGGNAFLELSDNILLTEGKGAYQITVYAGPRDFFKLRDDGFQDIFSVGILNKIGLMLVLLLKAIASLCHNYGIAIVILAAVVTSSLSPFTVSSIKSMKRMQKLQPKIEQLKKKYEKEPAKLNKEMFELFREEKVSPLGGCLPMLLQLPVFFALWSALSHVTELRGERFLWIKDLSLPDRIAKLPGGLDLNLLPIVMAIAMLVQSKLSQPKVQTGQPQVMNAPVMSIVFGFMFYQVPSGLVLYWITNSLVSIAAYRFAKV